VPLDDLSPVPRYRQVAGIIRARIETGQLAEGDQIPSRDQMQQDYGIARDTAAKALRLLVDEGLVVVVPGRGARVARRA
jgi:DNA-binding GntR family transcriptional regulator